MTSGPIIPDKFEIWIIIFLDQYFTDFLQAGRISQVVIISHEPNPVSIRWNGFTQVAKISAIPIG